jgi:hypothetical protein
MADDDDYDDDFQQPVHPVDDYDVHQQIQSEEQLPQDFGTPFSDPDDAEDEFTSQHSLLDNRSDMSLQEIYDEGEDDAAVDLLSSGLQKPDSNILGYEPSNDSRRKS